MYTRIWNKYLPVIKILLKKSATTEQTLDINRIDFEYVNKGRKTGLSFNIAFADGRVTNNTKVSEIARCLITLLMDDTLFRDLLSMNNYELSFNTKYQLHIKNCGSRAITAMDVHDTSAIDRD